MKHHQHVSVSHTQQPATFFHITRSAPFQSPMYGQDFTVAEASLSLERSDSDVITDGIISLSVPLSFTLLRVLLK